MLIFNSLLSSYKQISNSRHKFNLTVFGATMTCCVLLFIAYVILKICSVPYADFCLGALCFFLFLSFIMSSEYIIEINDFWKNFIAIKNNDVSQKNQFGYSDDMLYFFRCIKDKKENDFNYKYFSHLIKENMDAQDYKGATLLHHIIKHDPYSPLIPQILLFNSNIDIADVKGTTARMLIHAYCPPDYLVYIEKITLHSKINTNQTTPLSKTRI